MGSSNLRLAYLVSHPIQYQAPLLRQIAAQPGIDLHVFFCSRISTGHFRDREFGTDFSWDVPLLEGYPHEFLPSWDSSSGLSSYRPLNHGWVSRMRRGKFDVLWVHGYARPFNLWAMLSAKYLGIKVLLRDEATPISAQRSPFRHAIKNLFFSQLKQVCDGYLAIGTLNRDYYKGFGIPPEKIFMVPYSVDNHFFQERARAAAPHREALRTSLDLTPGRPIILFASKLIGRKRPFELLEAYVQLCKSRPESKRPYLLYVGDGPLMPLLKQKVADLREPSIRLLGFRNQTELPAYYDLCDVFVLPSINEPWGLVVNEVMNVGRPVVASDQVGSAPDLVRNETTGFTYKAGNMADLVEKLRILMDNKDLRLRMGENALLHINTWSYQQDLDGLQQALSHLS